MSYLCGVKTIYYEHGRVKTFKDLLGSTKIP